VNSPAIIQLILPGIGAPRLGLARWSLRREFLLGDGAYRLHLASGCWHAIRFASPNFLTPAQKSIYLRPARCSEAAILAATKRSQLTLR
jgi:hypothetical protein